MNADQVRAYVAAKWPEALQSPAARLMAAASAMSDSEIDVIREALQFLGPRTLGVDRSICEDLVTEIGPRAPATTKVPS